MNTYSPAFTNARLSDRALPRQMLKEEAEIFWSRLGSWLEDVAQHLTTHATSPHRALPFKVVQRNGEMTAIKSTPTRLSQKSDLVLKA